MKNPVIKTDDPNLAALSQELIQSGIIVTTRPDTCWLDSSRCPYGLPEGTFEKRPEICFVGGCKKLINPGITEFCRNQIADEVREKIDDAFETVGRNLADEVKILAEDQAFKASKLERLILTKAAEIVQRWEKEQELPLEEKIIKKKDLEEI